MVAVCGFILQPACFGWCFSLVWLFAFDFWSISASVILLPEWSQLAGRGWEGGGTLEDVVGCIPGDGAV